MTCLRSFFFLDAFLKAVTKREEFLEKSHKSFDTSEIFIGFLHKDLLLDLEKNIRPKYSEMSYSESPLYLII